ncbi:MAG TPA: cupredoxin domain-containing protein [Candidatus Saccharimonadales bacterium]|nr:cupredoxin domain-containing protein [Candidatus Saccharimonadales bacterium]
MEQADKQPSPQPSSSSRAKKKLLLLVALPVAIGLVAVVSLYLRSLNDRAVVIQSTEAQVEVTDAGFVPQTLKVKKGQPVSWVNIDPAAHHLLADPDKLIDFEAEALDQGDTYTYIFENSGTFTYYDPGNPNQFVGSIIVE